MTSTRRPPSRVLDTPITFLKGVGERRAEAFRRLGVLNARDLLFHIPHRYEDASTVRRISTLRLGEDARVIGTVVSKGVLPTRKGLRIFQAVVQDGSGLIEASWPGQPFLDRSIDKGDVLLLSGTVITFVTVFSWLGRLELWHIYIASIIFGFVEAFFFPAYLAVVPQITPGEHLQSANSLNGLSQRRPGCFLMSMVFLPIRTVLLFKTTRTY